MDSGRKSKTDLEKINVDLAVILSKVNYIEGEIKDLKAKLEGDFVTQDQFEPVKRVVYGLVSLILVAVVGALIALVINK